MKPTTVDDVLDLMDESFASAALGTAMELGLFWLLETKPLDAQGVAHALGIPPRRCYYWLQLLCRTGLIEEDSERYQPSSVARRAILEVYSRESWTLLAEEARERLPGLCGLPLHIRASEAASDTPERAFPTYLDKMAKEEDRARRFTRMLYEIHQPLADELTGLLDLGGVNRLMDLGGGSGVVSLALARRYPGLCVTVVDIDNVCAAGREIAIENSLDDRVIYHPADFLRDELPSGYDVVLECDVNVYSEALFHKVWHSLNPGGRFVIIDHFAPAEGAAPPSRMHWAFEKSLTDPDAVFPTAAGVRDQLTSAGFRILSESPVPSDPGPCRRFMDGLIAIEAIADRIA